MAIKNIKIKKKNEMKFNIAYVTCGLQVKNAETDRSQAKSGTAAFSEEQTSANDKDIKASTPISPVFQQPTGVGVDKPVSQKSRHSEQSEFVSDSFQTNTETDLEEIKDGMRKLGIDSMAEQALGSDGKRFFIYFLSFN